MRKPKRKQLTAAEIQAIRSIAAEEPDRYAAFDRLCDEVERLRVLETLAGRVLNAGSQAEERRAVERLVLLATVSVARAA